MMVKLGDICCINPSMSLRSDDYEVSFVSMPMVSETGDIDTSTIRQFGEVKKGFTYFEEGDVLFAKITPCMENGKGAIARGLMNGIGFGSTEFHVLRPSTEYITSEWLYYLTSWDVFRKQCEKNMTGSAGQKRVPKGFLEKYTVNLPSLEEQAHQTAVLDKVSGLIALRKKQLQKMDELVKARFVEMFGVQKYQRKTLGECTDFVDYRGHTPELSEAGTIRMINAKSVGKGFFKYIDEYVTEETYDSWMHRGFGYPGDILFVTEGHTFGNTCLIPDNLKKFALGQRVITIKGHKELLNAFLCTYMQTDMFWKDINVYRTGGTAQGIRSKDLVKIHVPIPPIELQTQFARFVEQTDKSKLAIQNGLERLELMKKALMQKYFG